MARTLAAFGYSHFCFELWKPPLLSNVQLQKATDLMRRLTHRHSEEGFFVVQGFDLISISR